MNEEKIIIILSGDEYKSLGQMIRYLGKMKQFIPCHMYIDCGKVILLFGVVRDAEFHKIDCELNDDFGEGFHYMSIFQDNEWITWLSDPQKNTETEIELQERFNTLYKIEKINDDFYKFLNGGDGSNVKKYFGTDGRPSF